MGVCISFSATCRKEPRRSSMNFAVLRSRFLSQVFASRAIFPSLAKAIAMPKRSSLLCNSFSGEWTLSSRSG